VRDALAVHAAESGAMCWRKHISDALTVRTYSWVWSVQAVNNKLYVTFADLFNPSGGGWTVGDLR
jgi:hypothetical protein